MPSLTQPSAKQSRNINVPDLDESQLDPIRSATAELELEDALAFLENKFDHLFVEAYQEGGPFIAFGRLPKRASQPEGFPASSNPAWELLTAYAWPQIINPKTKCQSKAVVVVSLPGGVGIAACVADSLERARAGVEALVGVMTDPVINLPAVKPENIWDALSIGARLMSDYKSETQIRAMVITLHGRGRVMGPVDVDRLIRFGVSEWR